MASIGGVGGSSGISGLYNSANIISGLASGMDTEGMIESLVQSYQNKILGLNNKATKIQWKQDAYRSIIAKMTAFSSKYASYTSSTNLMSSAFFNSAVKVAAQGKNGEKVTASGRTDSNVVLNGVSQLATAARYTTKAPGLKGDSGTNVTAKEGMDFEETVTLSNLKGSLSFGYGSKTVSINFDEFEDRIGLDADGKPIENLSAQEKSRLLGAKIEEKLKDERITLSSGESVAASERIGVKVGDDGEISFYDKSGAGNKVYISSASEDISNTLGLEDLDDADNPVKSFKIGEKTELTRDVQAYEYLSGKTFNINVDGVTKSIQMPQIKKNDDNTFTLTMPSTVKDKYGNTSYVYDTSKLDKNKYTVTKQGDTQTVSSADEIAGAYTKMLQDGVKKAFGDKLTVENKATDGKSLQLDFQVKEGSNLLINTSAGEVLRTGRTATNYLNTGSKLGDLMADGGLDNLTSVGKDEHGNDLFEFKINGEVIGKYTKDSTLSEIMNDVNSNSEAGVKISYSKTTRQFVLTSKETGSENGIEIEKGGLAAAIFGSTEVSDHSGVNFGDAYGASWLNGQTVHFELPESGADYSFAVGENDTVDDVINELNSFMGNHGTASYNKYTGQIEITNKSGAKVDFKMWAESSTVGRVDLELQEEYGPGIDYAPGQDAKFKVTVDGVEKELTRGSNSVDIDGLTINFKETFNESYAGGVDEDVTFQTSTDADKIVDAVKDMITDYNEMMSEIRKAYATMPAKSSGGALKDYEPLTEEQKASMSENEIKNYEEKAKQGILFADNNLRNLYERMRDVFEPSGMDSALLSKIGISSSFSSVDNSTTITLDENKLRAALEKDPDEVADLFTRTSEDGSASNGIMQGLKTQLDRYAGLTGSTKGILVQQAGTPLNSLSLLDNQWQKQIDNISNEIEKWQDKLESQVDRYTSMFSKLEVLINQMNSQSSTLAGMMGG
ncbi:MAG: flagellar filament capping protein FliD [Oscillospiraceae bacterium]|nr:flagellar filament capping protein FliD [Oscillospiraceae bacterium]